jgi:hypothetical protein
MTNARAKEEAIENARAFERAISASSKLAHIEKELARQREFSREASLLAERALATLRKEVSDVESWSGSGLKAILWKLFGQLDERVVAENREWQIAAANYAERKSGADAFAAEVTRLEDRQTVHATVARSLDEYRAQARAALVKANPVITQQLVPAETYAQECALAEREVAEALKACQTALPICGRTLNELGSAESLGTWDLFGGGMLVSMAKRSRVETALELVDSLHRALDKLRSEVSDLTEAIVVPNGLEVGSGSWGFDVWFDNVFSDWKMQGRIQQTVNNVAKIKQSLAALESHLASELASAQARQAIASDELDALILTPLGNN